MNVLQKYKGLIFSGIIIIVFACYLYLLTLQGPSLWNNAFETGRLLLLISCLSFVSVFFYKPQYLKFVLVGYVVIQLFLIGALAEVHNDSFRYIYDGVVSRADIENNLTGVSAFRYTPDEIEKGHVQEIHIEQAQLVREKFINTWWWELLDFKHLDTIYPGTAQSYFLVSAFFEGYEIIVLRIVLLLASLLLVYFILQIAKQLQLKKENLNVLPFLILNPIWFFDGVLGIHLEMLLITFLCAAIFTLLRKKFFASGVLLSLSIFTKLYPLLFLPVFLFYDGFNNFKDRGKFILGLLIGSVINLPFLYQKIHFEHLLGSVQRFHEHWIASPGLYYFIQQYFGNSADSITMILLVGGLIVIYYLSLRKKISLIHACGAILIVYIFLSKTIFSWYLLPLLVFLPFVSGKYKFLLFTPLIFYSLQYSFIDATNGVNNTFIYAHDGIQEWFQTITWMPVILTFMMIVMYKLQELNKN